MSCAEPSALAPRVLCAGIAVRDHVYRLPHFPKPGSKTRAREFLAIVGGCATNAATAIVRLGGRAELVAPLGGPAGMDSIGDTILAEIAQEGVDCTSCVRVPGATSPISAIIVDQSGERLVVNHRHEHLSVAVIADPQRLVRACDAVLADNRFAAFVLPLCLAARERGLPTVLDADRPTQASDALLTACSHVIFAADGLRATTGCQDPGAGLRIIAGSGDAFLAVTNGAEGVLWLDGDALHHMPAIAVNVVDTLGAGDVFHGAFALALAEGRSNTQALAFANTAAGLKCSRFGGGSGAPTRREVEVLLNG